MNDGCSIPLGSDRLVFLVGCFRSGTSLLQRLLNRHPDIALMWECDALGFLPARVQPGWTERLDLWNGTIQRHEIDAASLPYHASRDEAALALYRQYASQKGARVIGEKSPYYATRLRSLARRFPLAHFVILTRDPADVLASVRKAGRSNRFFRKPWMPLRVLKDAGRLRRDLHWLRNRGHAVHHLEFENLVADSDDACTAVWKFLGVPADPASWVAPDLASIPEGDHHHHVLHSNVDPARARSGEDLLADAYRTFWASRFMTDRPSASPPPSLLELARDETSYQASRLHDQLSRFTFRNAPIPVIRGHRERSGHPVCRRRAGSASTPGPLTLPVAEQADEAGNLRLP